MAGIKELLGDEPDDEWPPPCTDPRGHLWVVQDTDEIVGEGRCYCERCGVDGDG